MAASKRVWSETGSNPKEKRLRPSLSFGSVIVEVMRGKCFEQTFSGVLEPLLRRVVSEEVDGAIRRRILAVSRSPSLRIKGVEEQLEASSLKLVFAKEVSLPIFTGSKIHDCDKNPLQILLVREEQGHQETLPYPLVLKIELVAIDGDFSTDKGCWSNEEFESKIIRERDGRRPLLAGDLLYTMRDGIVTIGDIEFTDNSSWIRSRKFRLGARVVLLSDTSDAVRVLQAVSQPFVVRDHRGELYKKHYPPVLNDKVWRLEKIGKDGTFHQKLQNSGIITVQDFLKLSNVNQTALREILGPGMSDRMWEVTIKHARTTCVANNKVYVLRVQDDQLALNSICQVTWANINGTFYTPSLDCNIFTKARVDAMLKVAYENWGRLEELVEGPTNPGGPQMLGPPQIMDQPYSYNWENEGEMDIQRQYLGQYQTGHILDGPSELGPQYSTTNVEMGCVYYSNSSTNASFENTPDSS